MKESDNLDLTVACLQQAVVKMMTYEWLKEIAKLPSKAEQDNAKMLLVHCQEARLVLENAQLAEIRDKLKENEASLIEGRDRLKKSLERLHQVQGVLGAVSSLLSIVSRIVKL